MKFCSIIVLGVALGATVLDPTPAYACDSAACAAVQGLMNGIRQTPRSPFLPTAPGQYGDPRSPPQVPQRYPANPPNYYSNDGRRLGGESVEKYRSNSDANPYLSNSTVNRYGGSNGYVVPASPYNQPPPPIVRQRPPERFDRQLPNEFSPSMQRRIQEFGRGQNATRPHRY